MTRSSGEVLLVLRQAAGMTQEELADHVGVAQAALSRYENGLRTPDESVRSALAEALAVTTDFLDHEFTVMGAIAEDAHMRRQKTAKPADWKRVESRLNKHRMHTSYLSDRAPIRPQNQVIHVDPDTHTPEEAALLLRAAWKMPIGPVGHLVRWIEAAGVVVIEEDFGTRRIDGMSQWAGAEAVILINETLPTDRKRWTLAHEVGHLMLHANYVGLDMEQQANDFAAEFLMPAHVIAPDFSEFSVGKSVKLKLVWGTSMQALCERAYRLGKINGAERQAFYRQLSKRGWRTREPDSDLLPPERPTLAESIGQKLRGIGLSNSEIKTMVGVAAEAETPFLPEQRRLRAL